MDLFVCIIDFLLLFNLYSSYKIQLQMFIAFYFVSRSIGIEWIDDVIFIYFLVNNDISNAIEITFL